MYEKEIDKVSYSLGVNIALSIKQQGFEEINPEAFVSALIDVYENKNLQIQPEECEAIIEGYFQKIQEKKFEKNIIEGAKFLASNKLKDGVYTLESGLQYKILKEGNGPKPKASDNVTTHYHGTLISGKVFDSSVERGQPATFPVNGVIPGWVEALQLMPTGSKWQLFIPPNLAYGQRGASADIGPNTTLIFEVELLSIN